MMKKKKILALSVYTPAGIGQHSRAVLAHLHSLGHEIWMIAGEFDGNAANVDRSLYPFADRMIACTSEAPFATGILPEAVSRIQPDLIFSDIDIHGLQALLQPEQLYANNAAARHLLSPNSRHFIHLAYFPIESLCDDGFLNQEAIDLIGGIDFPVCYSRFAHEGILRSTGLDIPFIPLAIESDTFFPFDKALARRQLNFPSNAFIVAMVASNKWRKLWPEFFAVMERVTKRHPDVRVLPWALLNGGPGSYNFMELLYHFDLSSNFIIPSRVLPSKEMGQIYSAVDLSVMTSACESFGLSAVQARACGIPALVSAHTALVEFAGHPLELIPAESAGLTQGFGAQRNTEIFATDLETLEARIELLYANRELLREVGDAGLKSVSEYRLENIIPRWTELLETIG
jgi:glycosyltransferase involved in cell wall biosynthesis